MTSFVVKPADKKEYQLIKDLLQRMKINFVPLEAEPEEDDERNWYESAMEVFSKNYSDDEPDYENLVIKEPNPDYKPYWENKK